MGNPRIVESEIPAPERRGVLQALATAGIVGPIIFTVGLLAQDLLRSDNDPIAMGLSALEAGPYGWVQAVNFVLAGLAMIAFAVGLHRGMRAVKAGVAGPAIVALGGVGLVVAGVFPLRGVAAGAAYDPIGVHTVNNTIFGVSLGIGLVVISRRLTRDPRWPRLDTYALATGIAVLAMAVSVGVLTRFEPGLLDQWYGLLRRLTLAVWFSCVVILALRLRRVAGATMLR